MKKAILIVILAVALSLPSLNTYFSGDDFFHLKISQMNNLGDFFSFFSFDKNNQSASFYRPLTTQVFFSFGQKLFGLNPVGYHLFSLITFAVVLLLVYLLAKKITKKENIALLALFFYAFSTSHFTPLYYLSAFQELGMAAFYFAGLIFWTKYLESNRLKYLLFTILLFAGSLLSKEMAVTFPLLAGVILLYKKKQKLFLPLLSLVLIDIFYLALRLGRFGWVAGDSYVWDISPQIINTVSWYLAWSIGFPEMFLDFIGPKLSISNKLLLYYNWQTKVILSSILAFVLLCILAIIRTKKNLVRSLVSDSFFFLSCFIIALIPVIFLPWHKFPLELTIPLFGVSLFLGNLFSKHSRLFVFLAGALFLVLNLASYVLTYQNHWVIRRGEVARKVNNYFQEKYPFFPLGKEIYFYNNSAFITAGWGASKHIWISISGSDALNVFYQDNLIKVSYEDIDGPKSGDNLIRLGSKDFLGY